MERNSRDFRPRVSKINQSTEVICDFLNNYTVETGKTLSDFSYSDRMNLQPVLTKIYYPKYITPEHYRARMRHMPTSLSATTFDQRYKAGYGGLFSITFTSLLASKVFFDTLPCCKGPSLGTNFTLASPYVVLAHYLELDWAAQFEVEEGLVRVSIGLEDQETLQKWFRKALEAAELADAQDRTKSYI